MLESNGFESCLDNFGERETELVHDTFYAEMCIFDFFAHGRESATQGHDIHSEASISLPLTDFNRLLHILVTMLAQWTSS